MTDLTVYLSLGGTKCDNCGETLLVGVAAGYPRDWRDLAVRFAPAAVRCPAHFLPCACKRTLRERKRRILRVLLDARRD